MMGRMTPGQLAERLAQLPVDASARAALARQGEVLAEAVREALSEPAPGGHDEAAHDVPWRRSGALRDSIGVQAAGDAVRVGSSDQAARPQELGTARMPPRPFLAPAASRLGEAIAEAVGAAVVELFG